MLVAIAIPIFTSQLEKSKEATDLANVRSAYAEAVAQYLSDNKAGTYEVKMTSTLSDMVGTYEKVAGVAPEVILKGSDPCKIEVGADGKVKINDQPATTSFAAATS